MLGKSLYEGLLVELPFAGFFLFKLASGRGIVGAHHLASLDPDLYRYSVLGVWSQVMGVVFVFNRNLLSLKYYDGDIEDFALNFTVATDELGQSKVNNHITLDPGT